MTQNTILYPAHFGRITLSPGEQQPVAETMQPPPRPVLALSTLSSTQMVEEKPGPRFSREDLEVLSSGQISSKFGDWFKPLDHHERLVRMPEPPLLLADRVTGILGEPGTLGKGTVWTETDVKENSWYLHQGHMPAGIMIESGQADLLLISWLGMDFHNQGERIYRLLGCELTYYGGLPKPGDTLCYDIHVDGYAQHGDVRLFFFHYDCRINGELRLKVRQGQAGFFTTQELADSKGVLWEPSEEKIDTSLPMDLPRVHCEYTQFNRQQLVDFSQGNLLAAFGKGFERAETHTRAPRIASDKMLLIDEIVQFELQGGPWGRGYMRALQHVSPDDWFFKGHFKNDPCMPGTLMLEAGLEVMATYLTAMGYTLDKDGWRFEPVTDLNYKLRCRGQVLPTSQLVTYEIFIEGVQSDPLPTLYAHLLGTVDGLKAFHTKIGLRLVPDWPLSDQHPLLKNHVEKKPVAVVDGFPFDYRSLLACAWGRPSEAFGKFYQAFDNHRRVPRLPGPPYHFMTRITQVNSKQDVTAGGHIEVEYDIVADAWYFNDNGYATMPFAVLLEAALQPCGWLASFVGSALTSTDDLLFRNLDGTGTQLKDILPTTGVLTTKVKCTSISRSAGMIIESFLVDCYIGAEKVYTMSTVFGFFPKAAFENQVGVPVPDHEKDILKLPANMAIDLTTNDARYFGNTLQLPKPSLLMIDRITGFWKHESGERKITIRAEKDVTTAEWFFKAHFFQDPVQPGSLGIEALIQVLQFYMLHEGMGKNLKAPRFEPLALNKPLTWKYRGQVTPNNKLISSVIHVVETGQDEHGEYAIAEGSLWVDGKRIYEVKNMGMRVVESH